MKSKIILLAVFFLSFFLYGCIQERSEEQLAIELADGSLPGKIVAWHDDLFERGERCNSAKFIESPGRTWLMNKEDRKKYSEMLALAKQCMPHFKREPEKIGESGYRVVYIFKIPSDCKDKTLLNRLGEINKLLGLDNLYITVDLKTREVELPDLPKSNAFLAHDSWEEVYAVILDSERVQKEVWKENFDLFMDCRWPADLANSLWTAQGQE